MADRKEQTPILHKRLPVPAARLYNYKENAENLSPNLRQVEERPHEFLHSDLNSKSKPLPQVRHSVSPAKALPKEASFCENQIGHDGLNSKTRLSTDHLHCEEDAGVKVVVRIRPLSEKEVLEDAASILHKTGENSLLLGDQHYTFDAVAEQDFNQQAIFEMVGHPMVEHCLSGFNGSIFAYGQTGSGKTYTMWGRNYENSGGQLGEDVGLVPRILEKLFLRILEEEEKHIHKELKYKCRCSVLEIYNEQIQDLLEPSQTNLQIREDTKTGVYVDNLTEENVSNISEAMNVLIKGLTNRKVGTTAMNFESSRSHCVFTCVVECQYKNVSDGMYSTRSSKINLVDLAGSERQKKTGAIGERLREAGNTNRSLTQLGNVINTLADSPKSARHRHIPYRNSRLTFLLQESLGGNAKLAMICAVSSANSCKDETVGTLRFAQRAKKIQNKAVINEETTIDTKFLREQICQLKNELSKVKLIGCHSELNNTGSTGALSMQPAIKDKECTDIELQGHQSNAQFDGCKNCTILHNDSILQKDSNLPSEEKKQELQDDIEDELLEELVHLHGGSEIPLGASMFDTQICEENDKLDPADPFNAETIVISVDENGIRFVSQQKLDKTSTIKKLQVELESCAHELESERRYSKEIQEALQTAMAGHVKLLEQYSELQEKYGILLVQQRSISKNMTVNGTVVMLDQSASSVRATRHQSFDYFEPKVAEIEELLSMLKEEETSATRAKDSVASIAREADTMCREVERLQKLHAKSMVICKELLKTQSHIHGTCPMCAVARRVQFKFLDQD